MKKDPRKKLLKLAKKLSELSRELSLATQQHDELLKEMGYEIRHDAGMEFTNEPTLPDWYVEMTDYGAGEITLADIDRLLSQLKKMGEN